MIDEALISAKRAELLREAFLFARGERLAVLRGTRLRRYDGRGLHLYSFIWGEIQALDDLVPPDEDREKSDGFPGDPLRMMRVATEAADLIFAREIIQQSKEEAERDLDRGGARTNRLDGPSDRRTLRR